MRLVIPTVFATSKKESDLKFNKLIGISKEIQIDFMDGRFVKAKSIGIEDIPDLKRYENNFEAHLMVKNPKEWIRALKSKGFGKAIFHFEACSDNWEAAEIISLIKKAGMKAWIAINPETPVLKIVSLINSVSGILVMGVHPGKEHQTFIEDIYKKIKDIREFSDKVLIEVDGGVNLKTAGKLKEIGVNIINAGSFVSASDKPEEKLKELKMVFL